ncbi:MAG: type III-B CRISPR module RAMP protein Cmr6, partial [Lentisphaeria bacterium]|nr:type III-B CRISPR module RAMP protein Cmr6 [Lentisphaeria bacterium]
MLPMQEELRRIVKDHCESAVLELQKFPELPDNGQHPQCDELKTFCSKINNSRNKLPSAYSLPAPPDGMGREFLLRSGGRLLVNHSGGLIENSNLRLHRLFGYPQIPGSALKGIARAYANENAEDREQFSRIFGGETKGVSDQQGNIAFLEAVPADKKWLIVVDVLTSHGGVDTKNPVPVFFPAVERGAVFRFQIRKVSRSVSDADLDAASRFLIDALTSNGVGAKTVAGYGWFEVPEGNSSGNAAAPDQFCLDMVGQWGMLGLEDHLEECFEFPPAARKLFVQRMIKDKLSLI